MKYSVVIVTYNRCELLKECIERVLAQQTVPSHIVVIDNASTDGTKKYLSSFAGDEKMVIRHLKENLGGAGGFYYGLKIAHELRDDWHLIIDDDAMLAENFAAKLGAAAKADTELLAVAGTVMTDGEIVTDHRQRMLRPGFRFQKIMKDEYEKNSFYCDTASFCGLMVSDQLVGKIGFPEKRYFIWYDDTEYCIRIRKETKIQVVTDAILDHKVAQKEASWPRHYTWKDYYGIRNRILMVRKHGNLMDRIYNRVFMWLNMGLRNQLFQLIHFHGDDWELEVEAYKKGVKDSRLGHTGRNN